MVISDALVEIEVCLATSDSREVSSEDPDPAAVFTANFRASYALGSMVIVGKTEDVATRFPSLPRTIAVSCTVCSDDGDLIVVDCSIPFVETVTTASTPFSVDGTMDAISFGERGSAMTEFLADA